jgi:hypothetical protein
VRGGLRESRIVPFHDPDCAKYRCQFASFEFLRPFGTSSAGCNVYMCSGKQSADTAVSPARKS